MGHDAEQDGDRQGEASSKASRWLLPKGSSFRHAVRGIRIYFLEHTHARFHLVAALCVMGIALGLGIDRTRCAVLLLAIGLVWIAEGLNTAIEYLADAAIPQYDPLVRNAKDVAAGTVLLAALIAMAVGVCVIGPPLLGWN